MTSEVAIKVTAKNDSAAGIDSAKQGARGLGDEFDKTSTKTKKTGQAVTDFERLVGDKMRLGRTAVATMGDEYDRLTDRVKKLRRELEKPGAAPSVHADLKKALADLEGIRRIGQDMGVEFGGSFLKSAGPVLSGLGKFAVPALVAGAVAAAPFIGAALGAAVLGGVGAGGIIGGVALAARDPAVVSAAEDLGAAVNAAFTANGESFVQPVVASLDKLATTGVQAAAGLKPGMDALAATIEPLADGIDGLVTNALPGLNSGMKAAAPLMRLIGDELPAVGSALGDMFATVAKDPDGAILAMKALFEVTKDVVGGVGDVIAWLSKAYEWSVRTGASATGALEDIFGWVPFIGDELARSNDDFEGALASLDKVKSSNDDLAVSTEQVVYVTRGLGVAAEGTADALTQQRLATNALVDAELASINAAIGAERAIDNLSEAHKENGNSLDIGTEKGRRNTESILEGIDAVKEGAQREYDLALAHGATVKEAEKAASTYRDKYAKELKEAAIKVFGNTQAVRDLLAELDKLNGKRITYTIVRKGDQTIGFKVTGGTTLAGDEGLRGHYSGGIVGAAATGGARGGLTLVNEHGPELARMPTGDIVSLPYGSTVIPAGQSATMSASAGGGGMVRVVIDLIGADADLRRRIQKITKVTGGGSVQVAFGDGKTR